MNNKGNVQSWKTCVMEYTFKLLCGLLTKKKKKLNGGLSYLRS